MSLHLGGWGRGDLGDKWNVVSGSAVFTGPI